MEPQGRGNVPARHTPERNKRLSLSKTTLESRVHVQTSWAECRDKKVSASSRRGDFSLDIPFYRTSPVTALLIRLSRVASCLTVRHFLYIVYLMSNRDYLGEFEHIVVLALLRLGDRAYGVTVRQEIEARTSREVSIGAIYATLDRLEAKGYVKSRLGDPTPERGGRSKRFFRVSAKGVKAVNRTHRALQSMTSGLDLVRSYS